MKKTEINYDDDNEVLTFEKSYLEKDTLLYPTILDMTQPEEHRLEALYVYIKKFGEGDASEVINKLCTSYEMSGTKSLRQYLYSICKSEYENFSAILKNNPAQTLHNFNKEDDIGFESVNFVYKQAITFGTPFKIELIKILMKAEKWKENACTYFKEVISNMKIDSKFRYKTILDIENCEIPKTSKTFFITEAMLVFSENILNETMYRILACQYVLQNLKVSDLARNKLENILLGMATDEKCDYNLRADATDVLLQLGSEENKKKASVLIMELGKVGGGNIFSIYSNAQNVHTEQIENSIKEALEFLKNREQKLDTIENIEKEIEKLSDTLLYTPTQKERLNVAFNRVKMDRALYSKYNLTISHILLEVWAYAVSHASAEEVKKRLLEEMVDMADTCSSGFASRLVNTLSGFGDFSIRISWRDQIYSYFKVNLDKLIQNMDNLRLQEKVMAEMILDSSEPEERRNFLNFLRKCIPKIRENLYLEFKEHVNVSDFDLYFRSALSFYESANKVF